MAVRVANIKQVERLIRDRGNEEEVEVRISQTLNGVSQARRMRELLHRKMEEKAWCVGGISTLRPFIPVAADTHEAIGILRKLDHISTRAADPAVAEAHGAGLQAAAVREAASLSEIGRRLVQSPMPPFVLLGEELVELGDDVQASNMPAIFQDRIRRARNYTKDMHGQSIQTVYLNII